MKKVLFLSISFLGSVNAGWLNFSKLTELQPASLIKEYEQRETEMANELKDMFTEECLDQYFSYIKNQLEGHSQTCQFTDLDIPQYNQNLDPHNPYNKYLNQLLTEIDPKLLLDSTWHQVIQNDTIAVVKIREELDNEMIPKIEAALTLHALYGQFLFFE